jgi:hypothetical protein
MIGSQTENPMSHEYPFDVLKLLCRSEWHNDFDYYGLFQRLFFQSDYTGRMFWGDGQSTKAELTFEFKFLDPARMLLTCHDTLEPNSPPLSNEVGFVIVEGPHRVFDKAVMSGSIRRQFRLLCKFDRDPFPLYSGRPRASLDYYAGEIETEDMASSG